MYIFRKLGANFVYGSENQGNTQSKIMIEFDLKRNFFSIVSILLHIFKKRQKRGKMTNSNLLFFQGHSSGSQKITRK